MIEPLFAGGTHEAVKQMLDLASLRQKALASNVANVETPGYRRVDLDRTFLDEFQARLRRGESLSSAASLTGGSSTLPPLAADPAARAVRPDGNNVEVDRELLQMSRNTMEYDVLTEFASSDLRRLKTAITGREG